MLVILFLPRRENNNLIDLMSSSWIFTQNNKVLCRYPGSVDCNKILYWTATLKEYEEE